METVRVPFYGRHGCRTEIYTQTGVSGALRIDQQYDWLGRVVEQERYSDAAGTTLIATASYDYNSAGQITELNDDAAGTLIASYTDGYDGIGELTQQTINGTMTTLTYDQLGELTSGDSTSQTYTSSGNRTTDTTIAGNEVTYDGNYSYAYDPEGNETLMYDTTTDTTWAYTYDNDNHMTEAVETVSSTTVMEADYQYDAFGNMTEEEVITYGSPNGTAITQYVIDSFNPAHAGATGLSGSNVLADLNGGGTLMTHYVWGDGIDQLFGRYDAGGTLTADPAGIYGTMTDQNGSVCDVIDNTGTLKVAVQYDAWGNILTVTGPGVCMIDPQYYLGDFTYDTYDYDAATGYYDVNARVYSSASGRWLSQDPMGFDAGDSNLYRYVNNRPTEATDPSGLWTWTLSATGQILAIAEKGDTLANLVSQNYDKAFLNKVSGGKQLDAEFESGKSLDITSVFPSWLGDVLKKQQSQDFDTSVRPSLSAAIQAGFPRGKTFGENQRLIPENIRLVDADSDTSPYGGYLSLSANEPYTCNCLSFVALLTKKVTAPPGTNLLNFNLGILDGNANDKKLTLVAGISGTPGTKVDKPTKSFYVIPAEGTFDFMTNGRQKTDSPEFNSIVFFVHNNKVIHVGLVLGRSRNGDVFVLNRYQAGSIVDVFSFPLPSKPNEFKFRFNGKEFDASRYYGNGKEEFYK